MRTRNPLISGASLFLLASCAEAPPATTPAPVPPPVATAPTAPPAPVTTEPPPLGRLPSDARPTREKLALTLDPESERFGGTATIDLALDQPRDVVWLHGRGLDVSACDLVVPSGEHVGCTWAQVDPIGVAKLSLARAVTGAATVTLHYDAAYDPSLVGVYRSSVAGGRHAVFSKFEAIYARRAFPCFDEPRFKIPYDVTLTVPKGLTVLGNMPVASTVDHGGAQVVTFATTPPLPTYLVAFAAGPFDARATSVSPSPARSTPLPLVVDAVRGRGGETAFAAGEAPAIIAAEERTFGLAYPFPKLDLLAVPDFQSGAMENAGLITFRDAALLVDPATSTVHQRISVLETIAHEVAHQWFGDLVTMPWWEDLWLNESFASFLATYTLEQVKPELETELLEVASTNEVMKEDGLASARKIRQPIASTDDITNAFDGITYAKGEAVLSMVEAFLGKDAFESGLHAYLAAHAGGSATTADLVSALSEASHRDLAPLFASFLDQPGVPLVTARATCEAGKGGVALTQKRWIPVGSSADAGEAWTVPVCVRAGVHGKVERACTVLEGPSGTVPLDGGCADWVMPNADARGYYRFVLDAKALAALDAKGLGQLTAAERLALGGDLDATFRSADLSAADALRATEAATRDAHGAVAIAPMGLYLFVTDDVLAGDMAAKARARVRALYAPAAKALGWRAAAGESSWRTIERSAVLGFLARRMDDPAVLAEGARLGRKYLGLDGDGQIHPEVVQPELAPLAVSCAMRTGDAKVFDAILAAVVATDDAPKRRAYLEALASAREPALVDRALDLALDARLKKNERLVTVGSALGAPATRDRAWSWIVAHFDAIAPTLPDRYAGRLVGATPFCDATRADEVNAFYAPRAAQYTGATRNLANAVEAMRSCAVLAQKQRLSAEMWAGRK